MSRLQRLTSIVLASLIIVCFGIWASAFAYVGNWGTANGSLDNTTNPPTITYVCCVSVCCDQSIQCMNWRGEFGPGKVTEWHAQCIAFDKDQNKSCPWATRKLSCKKRPSSMRSPKMGQFCVVILPPGSLSPNGKGSIHCTQWFGEHFDGEPCHCYGYGPFDNLPGTVGHRRWSTVNWPTVPENPNSPLHNPAGDKGFQSRRIDTKSDSAKGTTRQVPGTNPAKGTAKPAAPSNLDKFGLGPSYVDGQSPQGPVASGKRRSGKGSPSKLQTLSPAGQNDAAGRRIIFQNQQHLIVTPNTQIK
jgi:hypothetical protein